MYLSRKQIGADLPATPFDRSSGLGEGGGGDVARMEGQQEVTLGRVERDRLAINRPFYASPHLSFFKRHPHKQRCSKMKGMIKYLVLIIIL